MKINKIKVFNLKAINREQTVDLQGSSVIVTAGNDKGKSSLLKSLIDRFHGEKPELIVNNGQEKGFYYMELTDGSRIEWNFTQNSERFVFTTPDGFKQTTGVLKAIGERYFGSGFDIDRFLRASPKEKSKMLQDLVGLDFTEVDQAYNEAFEQRKDAKKEVDFYKSQMPVYPDEVKEPDVESVRTELKEAKEKNRQIFEEWKAENERHLNEKSKINHQNYEKRQYIQKAQEKLESINNELTYFESLGFKESSEIIDKLEKFISELPQPEQDVPVEPLPDPQYIDVSEIEKRLDQALQQKREFDDYKAHLNRYERMKDKLLQAEQKYEKAQKSVKEASERKNKMIQNAELPEGFEIDSNNVRYKGYNLDSNQISSSAKHIAALKLGAMKLGELRAMHFDASFLDRHNLDQVHEWAENNDLQLLVERHDFDGGEIQYDFELKK